MIPNTFSLRDRHVFIIPRECAAHFVRMESMKLYSKVTILCYSIATIIISTECRNALFTNIKLLLIVMNTQSRMVMQERFEWESDGARSITTRMKYDVQTVFLKLTDRKYYPLLYVPDIYMQYGQRSRYTSFTEMHSVKYKQRSLFYTLSFVMFIRHVPVEGVARGRSAFLISRVQFCFC